MNQIQSKTCKTCKKSFICKTDKDVFCGACKTAFYNKNNGIPAVNTENVCKTCKKLFICKTDKDVFCKICKTAHYHKKNEDVEMVPVTSEIEVKSDKSKSVICETCGKEFYVSFDVNGARKLYCGGCRARHAAEKKINEMRMEVSGEPIVRQ